MIFTKEYKYKNHLIISFFLIFFILGALVHDDYGISWEEDNHRLNGQTSIRYIDKFIDEFSLVIEFIFTSPPIRIFFPKEISALL